MTPKLKPDASRIRSFQSDLKTAAWLGPARRWWPDFVFHVTDIQNAVSILRSGILLCREEALAEGVMATENASPDVLEQTEDRWKGYARLYFRPRTPTHYRSEGFRPLNQQELNSHLPVPVCFLFDAFSVLSRAETKFSAGNLAHNPDVFYQAADLEKLPFELIYHVGPFTPEERDTIVFHRNAEVIIPRLDLDSVQLVGCRSQAEYEILLHLLPSTARSRWMKLIGFVPQLDLFEQKWTYVETAELSSMSATFKFNNSSLTPGPFHIRVDFTDTINNEWFKWEDFVYNANQILNITLREIGPLQDYSVRLLLDNNLAYAGRYQADDLLPW